MRNWILGILGVVAFVGVIAWLTLRDQFAALVVPLLASGALGGLAQALLAGQGKLRLPGRIPSSEEYDMGFVTDLFIGMMGAAASLILGLAVLNERFFSDAPALARVTVTRDTAAKEAGRDPGADAAPSAGGPGALALTPVLPVIPTWVRIMSFGALTGLASRRLLPQLSERVANLITSEVHRMSKEIRQEQVENNRSQVEILQTSVAGLAKASRIPTVIRGAEAPAPAGDLDDLAHLVAQCDAIDEPDYMKRVAAKQEKATEMLALILRAGLRSTDLLARITPKSSEAWVLGLATLIAARPELDDGTRLLEVADRVKQKFVQYRILIALYSLKTLRLLTPQETARAITLVEGYLATDDPSLRRKAEATLSILKATP